MITSRRGRLTRPFTLFGMLLTLLLLVGLMAPISSASASPDSAEPTIQVAPEPETEAPKPPVETPKVDDSDDAGTQPEPQEPPRESQPKPEAPEPPAQNDPDEDTGTQPEPDEGTVDDEGTTSEDDDESTPPEEEDSTDDEETDPRDLNTFTATVLSCDNPLTLEPEGGVRLSYYRGAAVNTRVGATLVNDTTQQTAGQQGTKPVAEYQTVSFDFSAAFGRYSGEAFEDDARPNQVFLTSNVVDVPKCDVEEEPEPPVDQCVVAGKDTLSYTYVRNTATVTVNEGKTLCDPFTFNVTRWSYDTQSQFPQTFADKDVATIAKGESSATATVSDGCGQFDAYLGEGPSTGDKLTGPNQGYEERFLNEKASGPTPYTVDDPKTCSEEPGDPVFDPSATVKVDCFGNGTARLDNTMSTAEFGFEVVVNGEVIGLYMVPAGETKDVVIEGAQTGTRVIVRDGEANELASAKVEKCDDEEPPVEDIYYDVYADCFGFGYVYVDTYDSEAPFSGSLEVNGEVTDIELAPGEVFDAYFEDLEVGTTLVLKDSEGNVLGSATVDECPEPGKIEFVERCGGFEVTNLDTDRFVEFTYGVYPIAEGVLVLGPGESSGFVPTDITNLDYQAFWSDGAQGELMSATIEQDCDGKPETPDTPTPPSTDTPDDKPRPNWGASSTSYTAPAAPASSDVVVPTALPSTGATGSDVLMGAFGALALLLGAVLVFPRRRRELS